jgi:biotin carboxyl carrier protein
VDTLTRYTVAVEGKQYAVDVTKKTNESKFTVKIDEKPHQIELAKKLEYDTPLQIKIGEKTHTIQIGKPTKQTLFTVKIKDIPFKTEVKTQLPSLTKPAQQLPMPTLIATKSPAGRPFVEGAVTAPMAGKIVAIKVKKGDSVKAGTVLCVLEAMKMENEIVAPKTGTVHEISISEGATINEGDILIIIK